MEHLAAGPHQRLVCVGRRDPGRLLAAHREVETGLAQLLLGFTEKLLGDLAVVRVARIATAGHVIFSGMLRRRRNVEVTYRLPIGYGTFNVFSRYWWGQGDPLYAVLSRRGTSVDWVTVEASQAEVDRLLDTAHEILESSEDPGERNAAEAFLKDFHERHGDNPVAYLRNQRDNPLLPGAPPRYLFGGMGTPQLWEYRGLQVEVAPIPPTPHEPKRRFKACFHDDEGVRRCGIAEDEQGALANARYHIDLDSMGQTWRDAEQAVQRALDHMVDTTDDPINRGRLARHVEVLSRAPHPDYKILPYQMQAFYDLSLEDRLHLIEEVIELQRRTGLFDSKRRIPNPEPAGVRSELLAW